MHFRLFPIKIFVLLLIFAVLPQLSQAEEKSERPKVGLVLSGGGAKGFAHVGVLRILEQYNIPIDYIGGTSIGSIIGALYAVGYNADQLEEMILTQDWEALFADEPKRIYMPFYEREDQDRYQISMSIKNGKIIIPNYALSNNGIIRLFSDLTLGYHDIEDFSKLPTPFLCIAADLSTGNEVVLDSGYLPKAMAASMAIPGVFPAVMSGDKMLVDGGVRNNFPVDQIIKKGADIIIGVDVGAGMRDGEDIDKISDVIDQLTTMLGSNKYEDNHQSCDIYIKPDILEFTTADFSYAAAVELIEKGESKANEYSDEFEKLSEQFKSYDIEKRTGYHKKDSIIGKTITKYNISGSRLEDDAILGIMGIEKKDGEEECHVDEALVGLDRLKASMRFSSVKYKLKNDTNKNDCSLTLSLKENTNNFVNFGAHFNTQDDVSLLLNGTFNSLMLRNSRFSIDLKISDVPAFNLCYNINRGSLPGLGILYGYRSRTMNNYDDGDKIGEAYIYKNYFEVNTNSLVNRFFTVGLGARYESYRVDDILSPFPLTEDKYRYILYRFFFEIDTKDKSYYPTRGINCYSHTDIITDNGYDLNEKLPPIVTYFKIDKTMSFSHYWAFTPSAYVQLEYVTDNPTPLFYDTYVGGYDQPHDIVSQIPFWGLRWGEYRANNIVSLGAENRFRVADKHYLYFNFNAFANTTTLEDLNPKDFDYKLGAAIGYSYNSFIGPMEIFFSMSNAAKVRTFINIGYYF